MHLNCLYSIVSTNKGILVISSQCVKKNVGTTLRITKKNFQNKEFPCTLFLTTREKAKVRNDFVINMSMDINLKVQISKIVPSGVFHGKTGNKS